MDTTKGLSKTLKHIPKAMVVIGVVGVAGMITISVMACGVTTKAHETSEKL